MPMIAECMRASAASLRMASMVGMTLSAPSRPKRFWPT